MIANAAEIGVVMLVVLAMAKLFATSLLLATGWKGGYIFPIMFASIALGLAAESSVSRHASGRRRGGDDGRCARCGAAGVPHARHAADQAEPIAEPLAETV